RRLPSPGLTDKFVVRVQPRSTVEGSENRDEMPTSPTAGAQTSPAPSSVVAEEETADHPGSADTSPRASLRDSQSPAPSSDVDQSLRRRLARERLETVMSAMSAHRQPLGIPCPAAGPSSSFKPSSNVGPVLAPSSSRRDSVASTTSSCYSYGSSSGSSTAGYDSDDTIEEDDDEIATPPFLPADSVLAPGNAAYKGKGKADAHDEAAYLDLSGAFATFSLSEDDLAAALPLSPPSPTRPLPPAEAVAPSPAPTPTPTPRTAFRPAPSSSSSSKPEPSGDLAPAAEHDHAAHVRPPPQPSPPTRTVEEAQRGRSRWPRLLWRSELDMDSLVVLKNYHERAVGQPLPVLRAGMVPKQVETWSRRMEYAGL
ncbi:hypothetical protein JCM3774_005514, partial [Rhodotorula dairenensis]